MGAFVAEGLYECEFNAAEDHMTPGFFESCMFVWFDILEEFNTFFEPTTIVDIIQVEYDDT